MKGIMTTIMAIAIVAMVGFIWGPFNTDTLNVPVTSIVRLAETVVTIVGFSFAFKKLVIE